MTMSDTVNYKSEVLAWIEDFKAGFVRPPKPYEVQSRKRDVTIYPTGCLVALVSVDLQLRDDHIHWHVIHEMLHVGDWTEFKKTYQEFGMWNYYLHAKEHAPDSIQVVGGCELEIMLGNRVIKFFLGSLELVTYKGGNKDSVDSTTICCGDETRFGIQDSVEEINAWLRNRWSTKKIPKLLRQ